jgi:diguanylate cyclase (GGDEF)-like protein
MVTVNDRDHRWQSAKFGPRVAPRAHYCACDWTLSDICETLETTVKKMSSVANDQRLRVLAATNLQAFDRLTRLAVRLIGAPIALVSLVDERRQFFKSTFGLPEPWATLRGTPLTHSFCQYVVRDRVPLVVSDAREHAEFKNNLAVHELNVVAYAGMPLLVNDEAIGAFCIIDDKPHKWTVDEVATLDDLTQCVLSEIELRLALSASDDQRALTEALLESVGDGVLAIDHRRHFLIVNAAARALFADSAEVGKPLPVDWSGLPGAVKTDGTLLRPDDGALARGLRGESTDGLEFSLTRPGAADTTWVQANGRPVHNANGQVVAAVAVYRNVNEQKRQRDIYQSLVRNIPSSAVVLFDRDLKCLAMDGEIAQSPRTSHVVGRELREIAGLVGDARFDVVEDSYRRTLLGEHCQLDFTIAGRVLSLHTSPVRDNAEHIVAGIVLATDVSQARQNEAAIRRSEQIYREMAKHFPNGGVIMFDSDLRCQSAEGQIIAAILTTVNLPSLIGHSAFDVCNMLEMVDVEQAFRAVLLGQRQRLDVERHGRCFDVNVVPIFDNDQVSHALAFFYDVTTTKTQLAELEQSHLQLGVLAVALEAASITDELTGLLNRRGLLLVAEQQLKLAVRNRKKLLLFFFDLNGLKRINDSLGHHVGDHALLDTAGVLRAAFRESDILARLGGDEFVVLANDMESLSQLRQRLDESLARYNIAGGPLQLSLSVGTAVFDPSQPVTLERLIADADAGMYADKQQRRVNRT